MLRVLPAARGPEGLQNRRSGGGGGSPPPEGGSRRRSPGGSGGSPSHEGGRSRSTCVTSVCSAGRPFAGGARGGGGGGPSHAGSSAVGLGGSGRPAARTRAPAATRPAAASSAKKIPHWMPAVAAGAWTPGLSNSRHTTSTRAHAPAAETTAPSPPGRWKAWRCARAHTRNSTASATSRIAASTQVKTWSAERESDTAREPWKNDTWYHGSSSEKTSAAAAPPVMRDSGGSERSVRAAEAIEGESMRRGPPDQRHYSIGMSSTSTG